jgi:DNA polymerase kappa
LTFCSTFSLIKDKDKILEKLEEVAAELEKDLEQNGWTGRTVTLKYKLDTFQGNQILLNIDNT